MLGQEKMGAILDLPCPSVILSPFRLLLLIRLFISSFFFLSNFQTLRFFVTLSEEMCGLEG